MNWSAFSTCHGCRLRAERTNAFRRLFDLIDEGKTGEIDGVARTDFAKVVDQFTCATSAT